MPETTSQIHVSNKTDVTIGLSWERASGAELYKVSIVGGGASISLSTASSDAVVRGLEPGTWFRINVGSVGALGVVNVDERAQIIAQTGLFPATTRTVPVFYSRFSSSSPSTNSTQRIECSSQRLQTRVGLG